MHLFLQATCNNIQQELIQSVKALQHKDFSHVWAAGKYVINRDHIHQQEIKHKYSTLLFWTEEEKKHFFNWNFTSS